MNTVFSRRAFCPRPLLDRVLARSVAITALALLSCLPALAQQPLSYTFVDLDTTGLTDSTLSGASGGYAVGTGNISENGYSYNACAWNLSTGARMTLDRTGLRYYSSATGATNGFAVGHGDSAAYAWNLSTGVRIALDETGLANSYAYGASSGYAVGNGNGPVVWNLSTGVRTPLDTTGIQRGLANTLGAGDGYAVGILGRRISQTTGASAAVAWEISSGRRITLSTTGLTNSYAYGASSGYAVGYGSGTATSNANNAFAWNLSTGVRTTLENTGLSTSYARGASNGYAVGSGSGTSTRNTSNALAWDLTTSTRINLQSAFLPAFVTTSAASNIADDGTITGKYNGASAFALVPFLAATGATLAPEKTARVTGNINQTSGTTVIDGTYEFTGGVGNDTYTLAGGVLQGSGMITGNLVNAGGMLSPGNSPGAFTINGNFTQLTGGALNMEIASLSSFDHLLVTGDTTLGGTLNLSFASSFSGVLPASLDLITVDGNISGFFDQVNIVGALPEGISGYSLTTATSGSGSVLRINLVTVPESGTGLLFALPLLSGAVVIARRKMMARSER